MKKRIMTVILSTLMVCGMGIPSSVYGEDFISGDVVEASEAENSDEIVGVDSVDSLEDAETGLNDESMGFADGESEAASQQADILTEEPAENEIFSDEVESGTEELNTFDAEATGFDKAWGLSVNTTYTTKFTENNSERWYKITVPSDGTINIDFNHQYIESSSVFWKMQFFNNGNHEELAYYEFKGNQISYSQKRFGVAAGTYYIKLYKYSYSDTTFSFKINYEANGAWETERNDTYQLADHINVNEQYYGSLQRYDDVDWYTFTTAKDGYISFDFTHDYIENNAVFWQIELYNGNYSKLEDYSTTGKNMVYNSSQIGIPAGTYYLKIYKYNFNHLDLEYGLKINYNASDVWEKEFNDDYTSAMPINLNTTYYGSIQTGRSDTDWFKFTAPDTGIYKFSLAHDYIESSRYYWKVIIYDSLFEEQGCFRFKGNVMEDSNEVSLPRGGNYYIKITTEEYYLGGERSRITYTFNITAHTHSFTYDVTKATTSQDGTITPKCSCGYVGEKTTIYHPSSISVSQNAYTYNGKSRKPQVVVYDSQGNVISANNYTVSYASNTKSVGTHYVTIRFKENYSGTGYRSYVINPKAANLTKLSGSSKAFTAKWSKGKACDGYQLQYSTNKKFSKGKIITISRKSSTSVKCRGLKGKKQYYVRIRSYKTVSGKQYYSSWSAAKTVKTKR